MKLQLYTSTAGVPEVPHAPQISLQDVGAPYHAAAGALATVSEEAQKFAALKIGLDKEKKDTEAAIEAVEGRVRHARELTDSDIKRRNSPDFDLSTHDQWLQEEGSRIMENIAGGMKSPQAANLFRKSATMATGEKSIQTKYEYANHLEKRAAAGHYQLGQTLESEAINGPDALVDVYVQQYDLAARALIGKVDGYNEASVAKMTQEFREKVWGQRVHREASANPDAVKEKLNEKNADGTWKYYKGLSEEQRTKGFDFSERISEAKAEKARMVEERAERKARMEKAEAYENMMSDMTIRASRGKLSHDELVATGIKERIKDRDYIFLKKLVDDPGADRPSDARVMFALSQDVYGLSPKASMDMLRAARLKHLEGGAGINQADFEKLAGRLVESQKYWKGELKDEHRYRYTKAKEYLESRLKVSEFGDPDKVNKMYDMIGRAQEALFHRSTNGKEDPNAVVQSLMPRYLREMRDLDTADRDRVLGLLGMPKTASPQEIHEAKKFHADQKPERGSATWWKWEQKTKLFRELYDIEQDLAERGITLQQVEEDNQRDARGRSRGGSVVPTPGSPLR